MSTRDPHWNQQRSFRRGEVYFVTLQGEDPVPPDDSHVIKGDHRAVVLFDSEYPRPTVTIVPITSLHNEQGGRKKTFMTDVELFADEYQNALPPYRGTIFKDSFIQTDQVTTISRHLLEREVGRILPRDMLELDVKLIMTLGLHNTVGEMIEAEVQKRLGTQTPQEVGSGQ